MEKSRLGSDFFLQDTITVAESLLGMKLVHILPNGLRLSGKIVETEAYIGPEDPACHAFGSRRTDRTEIMYAEGGHAYVYFVYGMHFMFNVVTMEKDRPEAVLIRALEPLEGLSHMRSRRHGKNHLKDGRLLSGPGRICSSLQINRTHNGIDLRSSSQLFIEKGDFVPPKEIVATSRIGVEYAGDAAEWPLRFYIRHHPSVSKTVSHVEAVERSLF